MNPATRIILADDHAVLRDMLAARLAQEPDMEVVAAFGDATMVVETARASRAELVVLDIDMPGPSAFAIARQLCEVCPGARVVFLSAYLRDGYVDQALKARAAGYLVKQDSPELIVAALRQAARGRSVFSPAVRARMTVGGGAAGLAPEAAGRLSLLTPRELETLRYLAAGLPRKEIASTMDISPKTVEQHCDHLMQKLDIHDRVELARFAIREGLLEP
ncbi:MAG: response regulator transcription factor [Gammaproteobacteria bacterium]